MNLTIQIIDEKGEVLAQQTAQNRVCLVYNKAYKQGDCLVLKSDVPGYVMAQVEDTIQPSFGFLQSEYKMIVPHEDKRVSYSPKSFVGEMHLLNARIATPQELEARRNLALNPMDCHENDGFFPHAHANVETRGEAVFAARNAVNGNYANHDHGPWPFESWGVNRNPEAEIVIDFGRRVEIDEAVITLRADFPHDNWWQSAKLSFSDGSEETVKFVKTEVPQAFEFAKRTVTWAKMSHLLKDETDPSPFPALTQIEFWGHNL